MRTTNGRIQGPGINGGSRSVGMDARPWPGARSRRGSILMASVTILLSVGFVVAAYMLFVRDGARSAVRDRSRMAALYAAEAGVAQVVNWYNFPTSYTATPNPFVPFTYNLTISQIPYTSYIDPAGLTRYNQGTGGSETPVTIPAAALAQLASSPGGTNLVSTVSDITITSPTGTMPLGGKAVARITSTGRASNGVKQIVSVILQEDAPPYFVAPAAIMSFQGTNSGGNADVHWGEVWAKSNVAMQNNFTGWYPNPTQDQWFKIRTEGMLFKGSLGNYANGDINQGYSSTPIPFGQHNYYLPYEGTSNNSWTPYTQTLRQWQKDIPWPNYDYQSWKDYVREHQLPYYKTRPNDSNLYPYNYDTDTVGGAVSFDTAFSSNPSSPDYNNPNKLISFIDTTDGQAPAANGSNMTTVQCSGNSVHTRGLIFMGANFDKGGAGNPPSMRVQKPPPDLSDFTIPAVFHNGFLCSWGTINLQGNATIFGALFARDGFTGGGTPTVYYNSKLGDGSYFPWASRLRTVSWSTTPAGN